MPAKTCLICGMVPAGRKLFWFPKPTAKCQVWINALDINPVSPKELQGKKRLCGNHFSAASFRTRLKDSLNYNAVPQPVCIGNVSQHVLENTVQTNTMSVNQSMIITGNIIHCREPFQIQVIKGSIVVKNGKVESLGDLSGSSEGEMVHEIKLKDSQILIPGLIDTHIHAPQYPNVGLGYDKPLLEWLNTYTYPTEKEYKNLEYSERVYDALVKKTLAYGTTTACYFASLFKNSSDVLVDSLVRNGQRGLIGKINMITLAPDDYVESREESLKATEDFVNEVLSRKNHLVQPVITPRFALSVDMDLMKKLSSIASKDNLHIQSHISENLDEISMVHDIYHKEYAEVYDEAGLLTAKTIMAHGVHLTDSEVDLLRKRGTSIAHCPASNSCLQSGLCDVKRLINSGLTVGLGTDVSGGPSPSIIDAMRCAIETSIHVSYGKDNYEPLNYIDAFYLATLGGAKALSLDGQIGNFEIGKEFDALIVDMAVANSSADYLKQCTPSELLQKFVFLGDDRNVSSVFVNGKEVKT